jgi:hypothetical protein
MDIRLLIEQQQAICERYGSTYVACDLNLKVGVSRNVASGAMPINGLRIAPEGGTCGWYIWGGEQWSDDEDFFVPLHALHLEEWAPLTLPYLGLAPSYRFLITATYEDVWRDEGLIPAS